MVQGSRIGVVIPCYRTEQTIAAVVAGIPEYVDTIIAVNDASPDGTQAALEAISSPRLVVLRHEHNQGVGGALATGYAEALRRELDIVVKVDGDGQMAPEGILELVLPIVEGRCDYAKGNRFLHARELRGMPALRKLGSIALTFITKFASGYWHVFDPQNGFLAIARDHLASLDLERLRSRRYFFENEMLIQLNVLGARVLDCPMPARYRGENSSMKVWRVLLYFPYFFLHGFLFRMLNRYVLRDFSIIIPFYLLGSCLFLWGLGFGSYEWIIALRTNVPTHTGTIMLVVLPLILGLQFLLQGLLIDILQTPRALEPGPRSRGAAARQEELEGSAVRRASRV
ncbi:MAG: glycosyltransferase family 2 protein [Myxococcaceae bacterium]